MLDDREQFEQLMKASQNKAQLAERKLYLYQIRQAAVSSEHLTGNEYWDGFLRQIQGLIEQEEKAVTGWQMAIRDPMTSWDSGPMAFARAQLVAADARLKTLQMVLAIPKQLLEAGQQAKTELDQHA